MAWYNDPAKTNPVKKLISLTGLPAPFYKVSAFLLFLFAIQIPALAAVPLERQKTLRHMLKQDCGSCHGMTLKGGLGPALTASEIANKPKQLLHVTILDGRPGTPMPPFRGMLTEEEVHWLVERLYKGDI